MWLQQLQPVDANFNGSTGRVSMLGESLLAQLIPRWISHALRDATNPSLFNRSPEQSLVLWAKSPWIEGLKQETVEIQLSHCCASKILFLCWVVLPIVIIIVRTIIIIVIIILIIIIINIIIIIIIIMIIIQVSIPVLFGDFWLAMPLKNLPGARAIQVLKRSANGLDMFHSTIRKNMDKLLFQ